MRDSFRDSRYVYLCSLDNCCGCPNVLLCNLFSSPCFFVFLGKRLRKQSRVDTDIVQSDKRFCTKIGLAAHTQYYTEWPKAKLWECYTVAHTDSQSMPQRYTHSGKYSSVIHTHTSESASKVCGETFTNECNSGWAARGLLRLTLSSFMHFQEYIFNLQTKPPSPPLEVNSHSKQTLSKFPPYWFQVTNAWH